MDYPSLQQVESADREQVYRWFLGLPVPRLMRIGKGKGSYYAYVPDGVQHILDRVFKRWQELGGHDLEISRKILTELNAQKEEKK